MRNIVLILGLVSAGCAFDPAGEPMPDPVDPVDELAPDAGATADAEPTPPPPPPPPPEEEEEEEEEDDDGPGNSGPGGGGPGGGD